MNVVTVLLGSVAMKLLAVTVTDVAALRLSVADVTYGVSVAGAVPPEIAIGTLAAAAPLLMATTTTEPSVGPFTTLPNARADHYDSRTAGSKGEG